MAVHACNPALRGQAGTSECVVLVLIISLGLSFIIIFSLCIFMGYITEIQYMIINCNSKSRLISISISPTRNHFCAGDFVQFGHSQIAHQLFCPGVEPLMEHLSICPPALPLQFIATTIHSVLPHGFPQMSKTVRYLSFYAWLISLT